MARTRDFKAEYQRRIERALAAGKTRQAARGHKPQEHKLRAERERAKGGLTSAQVRIIRAFHARFDAMGQKRTPTASDMIAYARQHGYGAFIAYREHWNDLRRNYLRELKISKAAGRRYLSTPLAAFAAQEGLPIKKTSSGYYEDFYESEDTRDISWLYYH